MDEKEDKVNTLSGEQCPICAEKELTLMETEKEVPYFGKLAIFSMTCAACKYHKADVEALEPKEPTKFTFNITSEEDMKVRVIRSSEATVKIPHITTITPGPASNGFITNIEGVFQRVKDQVEFARDSAEDSIERKKAKNMLKKITNIMWGRQEQKLIIEDPSGNSAIISEKAEITKMKK
ncbi:MAG: ZPR1 zinc finger domain-containing protein [Nanoarchaeota archaeon]|nr:ZPR1 zinc finger domain-containing protein [Nanoarchaeota archaeon]